MNEKEYQQMEAWAQSRLARLPEKTAPPVIQALVMKKLERRSRASIWSSPWFQWPFWAKMLSTAVVLVASTAICYYSSFLDLRLPRAFEQTLELCQWLIDTFSSALSLASSPAPVTQYQIAMALVSYALILGIASVLVRQAKLSNRTLS